MTSKKQRTPVDYSQKSDVYLRNQYSYLHSNGKPLPQALHEELMARFPGYDPYTRTFGHKEKKHRAAKATAQPVDYSKKNDVYLRSMYHFYTKKGKALPAGLHMELIKRFPGYNAENQTFGHARHVQKNRSQAKQKLLDAAGDKAFDMVPLFSNAMRSGNYTLLYRNQKMLLTGASAPYALLLLDQKAGRAVVRKESKKYGYMLYIVDYAKGMIVSETKSGTKEIKVSPESGVLYTSGNTMGFQYSWAMPRYDIPQQIKNVPNNTLTLSADILMETTLVFDGKGNVGTCPILTLPDYNVLPRPVQPIITPGLPKAKVATSAASVVDRTSSVLTASAVPTKSVLNGTICDIYVNGKLLEKNILNPQIETFLQGTLLGIHGASLQASGIPAPEKWYVYDTHLNVRPPVSRQNWLNKKEPDITKIQGNDKMVKLTRSNNSHILLELAREQKKANGRKFQIAAEKQK